MCAGVIADFRIQILKFGFDISHLIDLGAAIALPCSWRDLRVWN
jgi:hypothetical protein